MKNNKIKTIHLVYPHEDKISCPDAIGHNLGRILEKKYNLEYYNWDSVQSISPRMNDILLGHPHPIGGTCFRRNIRKKGWKKRIILAPYNHGDVKQVAFIDQIISRCDKYLAITGDYWFDTIKDSCFQYWAPKMIQLDLAVDRHTFPLIKRSFNSRTNRKILYIGHTAKCKNIHYLEKIAEYCPDLQFSWIGRGDKRINGFQYYGYKDLSVKKNLEIVKQHDIFLTVGDADSNPATLLESMAWGLIPICTPQSGYYNIPSITNVPLNNAEAAAKVIYSIVHLSEERMLRIQKENLKLLDSRFNWENFANTIINQIEDTEYPILGKVTSGRRVKIATQALLSSNIKGFVKFWINQIKQYINIF